MAIIAGPAAANYPDGYSPIIPWHQDDVDVRDGVSYDFGARWGACTRGLAQSGARHFDVVVTVDGKPVGPPGWTKSVDPDREISTSSFADLYTADSFRDTGWWVFWNQPLTFDDAGRTHFVTVTMTARNPVSDGGGVRLPVGWSITETVTVHVVD